MVAVSVFERTMVVPSKRLLYKAASDKQKRGKTRFPAGIFPAPSPVTTLFCITTGRPPRRARRPPPHFNTRNARSRSIGASS